MKRSWHQPKSLFEALDIIASQPSKIWPVAGGTDLWVAERSGRLPIGNLIDISQIRELALMKAESTYLQIGACVPYSHLMRDHTVSKHFPNLAASSQATGAVAIQNRGTLGGNIMNASPAADSVAALMCYHADVHLQSAASSRWIPLKDFYTGYRQTQATEKELLTAIRLPLPKSELKQHHRFLKVGTRQAQAITKVGLAATWYFSDDSSIKDASLAFIAVAPTTLAMPHIAEIINGHRPDSIPWTAIDKALKTDIKPITDIRSTAEYRQQIALNLLKETFTSV